MHLLMFQSFSSELQKIAKDNHEPELSFFERHPKKIIGGTAIGLLGAALAVKRRRGKVGTIPSVPHSPKAAPHPKPSSAKVEAPATAVPPARKMTHDEMRAAGYPGGKPKSDFSNIEKHEGADYIQAVREEGKRRGMPDDRVRAATTYGHLDKKSH